MQVNPSMRGVLQIGPPIIPCGGSFAPLMQAYGLGLRWFHTGGVRLE